MKRILLSLASIASVGAVAFIATSAFFSDTETSVGNVFEAGEIDLQVGAFSGSESNGGLGEIAIDDLNDKILFSFDDLKPGDIGGGRFDMQANSNDYWLCMMSDTTELGENDIVDPEAEAGDVTPEGELQNYLTFAFWNDVNGDGEFDGGDTNLVGPWSGIPGMDFTVASLEAAGWLPMADNTGVLGPSFLSGSPLTPGIPYHLGYKYCFGEIQSNLSCDPAMDANDAQTDSVVGNLSFYAVQSRNNEEFVCSSINKTWNEPVLSGQNAANKSSNRPHINWTINGHLLEIEFVNPTNFSFPFEYRIDDEIGNPDVHTPNNITQGELASQAFGNVFNIVDPGSNGTTTRTFNANDFDDELGVILHRGAEQNWYLDWIIFETN